MATSRIPTYAVRESVLVAGNQARLNHCMRELRQLTSLDIQLYDLIGTLRDEATQRGTFLALLTPMAIGR